MIYQLLAVTFNFAKEIKRKDVQKKFRKSESSGLLFKLYQLLSLI
jgi:hypothetical protein